MIGVYVRVFETQHHQPCLGFPAICGFSRICFCRFPCAYPPTPQNVLLRYLSASYFPNRLMRNPGIDFLVLGICKTLLIPDRQITELYLYLLLPTLTGREDHLLIQNFGQTPSFGWSCVNLPTAFMIMADSISTSSPNQSRPSDASSGSGTSAAVGKSTSP